MKPTDITIKETALYFLPVTTRVPLKFGSETLTSVTCARVRVVVEDRAGRGAVGWGETPLSVQWVWPSTLPYRERHEALREFCMVLSRAWLEEHEAGHALEVGLQFQEDVLPSVLDEFNARRASCAAMPWLAALVCCSPFDIAIHDAYGNLLEMPTYATYGPQYLNTDLADWLRPEPGPHMTFENLYPQDFLEAEPRPRLWAWHLVGGMDALDEGDLDGSEPRDGYPVTLAEWIREDGLTCLKIKLRGTDADWDYARIERVGSMACERGVHWLSTDFNCTVHEPGYVTGILDRLIGEHPVIYGKLLYVEQPFPYELEEYHIDVHAVSARKPLFMDESAHDWRLVRLGRSLGWTGVALKTCKTQSGALLALCWAKAHGMTLMVQDLTNPMLAQIPHVLLAAHAGTIMGVETNSMQFYPGASLPEAAVHPSLYRRRGGVVALDSVRGSGFGYRIGEIARTLPDAAVDWV
jgi:L-alanine-DL-glutamate epimerase-like enolase superfamily enzyme